jgi:PAS domain-containing protein
VVLTEQDQEEVAREAVQRGAKDRVLKRQIDSNTFSLILRNIPDRAAADDALFIERERAQVTLNSIGDAVISTDKSGYVTYVNPAPLRRLRRSLQRFHWWVHRMGSIATLSSLAGQFRPLGRPNCY